jgi:hypothetical protein
VRNSQFQVTSNPLGGIVSHLTAQCGGNVHDKGAVEITSSSVGLGTPWNAADLGTNSDFWSNNSPGQRIS